MPLSALDKRSLSFRHQTGFRQTDLTGKAKCIRKGRGLADTTFRVQGCGKSKRKAGKTRHSSLLSQDPHTDRLPLAASEAGGCLSGFGADRIGWTLPSLFYLPPVGAVSDKTIKSSFVDQCWINSQNRHIF